MQGETLIPEVMARAEAVREAVARAADLVGREPAEVTIVAVTKGHPWTVVEAAMAAGFRDLGENRVESLLDRARRSSLEGQEGSELPRWHMVGRLQRRQASELHGVAHLVHSVDSLRLAERLDRTLPEGTPPLEILLQVNISGEEVKAGVEPDEAEAVVGRISELEGVRLRGLMTMAPFVEEEGVVRKTFQGLRRLHEALGGEGGYGGDILSMGMSNDYQWAVEEGSTMIRLGTVLFGERVG